MSWLQGRVSGEIRPDGSIVATTSNLEVIDGQRPRDIYESGADEDVIWHLRQYQNYGIFEPGSFETLAYLGGVSCKYSGKRNKCCFCN